VWLGQSVVHTLQRAVETKVFGFLKVKFLYFAGFLSYFRGGQTLVPSSAETVSVQSNAHARM